MSVDLTGLQATDFEQALTSRPCARTEHFALHHLPARIRAAEPKLSTAGSSQDVSAVDERRRLGLVVPKRHARRAVTRNLVKRQGRAAFVRHIDAMAPGSWVLRLRAPFDPKRFLSAASDALRRQVRAELDTLWLASPGYGR